MKKSDPYKTRIKRVRKLLNKMKLNVILFFSRENIRYLCGFSGTSGTLVCSNKGNILFTDSRYMEQARKEVVRAGIKIGELGLADVAEYLSRDGAGRAGIESEAISLNSALLLKKGLKKTRICPIHDELSELRTRKEAAEIRNIQKALRIAENNLKQAIYFIKEGVTEQEIATRMECGMKHAGSEELPFPVIVLFGADTSMPHGRPGKRRLRQGDFILIDFGARFMGYCCDETITFIFRRASQEQSHIYNAVNDARRYAIDSIRAGIRACEVDRAARGFLEKKGLAKYFGHGLGHGVGLGIHEAPRLSYNSNTLLEEGMVFTVEPGVYIPGWGGVRLEDMVFVRRDCAEVITSYPKRMRILEG